MVGRLSAKVDMEFYEDGTRAKGREKGKGKKGGEKGTSTPGIYFC